MGVIPWPKWKEWQLWTLAPLLLFLGWEIVLLAGYQPQECEEGGKACHALQQPISLLLYPFFWVADLVEGHDKIVVGLSGIAVAAFTFTLWRSTKALWKAGEAQGAISKQIADATTQAAIAAELNAKTAARALDELERPWLFLQSIDIKRRELPGQPIRANYWYVSLHFRNVGRAPAFVQACTFKIGEKATLPGKPDYTGSEKLTIEVTIAPNDEGVTNPFGPGADGPLVGTEAVLVAYGAIGYRALGGGPLYFSGYAIEVSPHIAAMSHYGSPEYTYYK